MLSTTVSPILGAVVLSVPTTLPPRRPRAPGARRPPQVLLVLGLDPRHADLAPLGVALVGVGGQEARRDGARVAEHLGRRRPALGVGALRTVSTVTPGYSRLVRLEVLDRGVGTPPATGTGSYGLYCTLLTAACTWVGVSPDQGGHLPDDAPGSAAPRPATAGSLPASVFDTSTVPLRSTISPRGGGDADHPHLVPGHGGGVGLAVDDLERPQPQDQHAEEDEHDEAHDAQPQARARLLLLGRADDGGDVDALARPHARLAGVAAPRCAAARSGSTAWGAAGRRGSGGGGCASPEPAVGSAPARASAGSIPRPGPSASAG